MRRRVLVTAGASLRCTTDPCWIVCVSFGAISSLPSLVSGLNVSLPKKI